ncbi:MAG: hypothetical protein K9I59_00470 [Chlorobium sp.]|uniref:hypothetical protein n=1 Tax=Chlorobium sp. TaxID=1095 RepID=UPI0025BF72C3|nr:hypothetical protein [Chlorobium sp.]MCF8215331.1 hypothetical protein [Chlorobium sp.]MCF8270168.1 hypothetical protein [Chlorobium sp.]MCF8286538.1 hypothetical protein [Chlorobium sp.]MCF8290136.1 hypothetical protein [Chlorobium sp.]MCF8384208.1 hypothetical protein [Chlorobium sp.]
MKPAHIIRVLPLCAVLLFTGCSSNAPEKTDAGSGNTVVEQPASKLIEPCELITGEDAATILGEAVKPAKKSEKQVVGMKLCLYNARSDSIEFLQVTLTQDAFMQPGGIPTASIYKSLKDNFEDMRTDIEGVGDEAFISTGGIYIMSDGYYIQIGAGNTSNETVRNRLIEAGKMAVAKLNSLK